MIEMNQTLLKGQKLRICFSGDHDAKEMLCSRCLIEIYPI